jgi:tetratricopeptide (TPR) repeat protein
METSSRYVVLDTNALQNTGDNTGALTDLNVVLDQYPDFYQGFYMRSEIKRSQNDMRGAERDYNYAVKGEAKLMHEAQSDNQTDNNKDKNEDAGTREKSDRDIAKFNLLVVADTDEQQKSKYQNEARGRVQDRQVKIELMPKYVISYYEKSGEMKSFIHFNQAIDNMNKKNMLSRRLIFTNNEMPLTEERVSVHFASINEYSKLIAEQPNNADLYFARALDYMLVQNFSNAIEDLNEAVRINPQFTLAYFNLAVTYTKQLELKEHSPEYEMETTTFDLDKYKDSEEDVIMPTPLSLKLENDKRLREYELIIDNYNKALSIDPDFVYAYYNRAEIRSMQRDYRAAILDYNEAIRKEPNFSDAYFNRGLDRLQLGEKDKGLSDLRKAGELGIPNAYNIIKRMSE